MKNDSLLPKRCIVLKNLRKENKKTQSEMAELLGVTVKTYRSWENGEYRENTTVYPQPALEKVIAIAEEFHCSVDYVLGRSECKSVDNDYISKQTGLSDNAINQLHKFTTYNQGAVRLAIIDYLLCDINFSIVLADKIDSYYTKYDFFESGKKRYFEECKTLHDLAGDNILKQIELQESGEFSSSIDRHKLAERESSRDAARFRVQKEFDNILGNLIKHFYNKNNSEDGVTK